MRVLLVGEIASARMGGEAAAPYNYFRYLPDFGVEVWLVTHARVRDELTRAFPGRLSHIHYIEDSRLDRGLYRLSRVLPDKLALQTLGVAGKTICQFRMRRVARSLIRAAGIDLVHQVYPISPKEPSALYGLGVPVVIGPPMSGGMRYPPGFRHREGWASRAVERAGRAVSGVANRLVPGKRRADALLVANAQTRASLPAGCRGRVYDTVSEVCIDPGVFVRDGEPSRPPDGGAVRFAYLGRLVDWKAVDLLLEAFNAASDRAGAGRLSLLVMGDGSERAALEAQARRLELGSRIEFTGWVTAAEASDRLRQADVFVLPSLRESGGISVVEAMAAGLPVIVADWGGPGATVDPTCGIRVPPTSPAAYVAGLADAMLALAGSPERRSAMGRAAADRVRNGRFTWPDKVEQTVAIYRETLTRSAAAAPPAG